MDDLEFRRRILSDPKQKDEEILQALADNSANHKFVEDVLDLDEKIKQAMNVEVPEDLADKILFSQSSSSVEQNVVRPTFAKKTMALKRIGGIYRWFVGWSGQLEQYYRLTGTCYIGGYGHSTCDK